RRVLEALVGRLGPVQEPGVFLDAVLDVRRCRRTARRQQRQAKHTNDCSKPNPHVTPSFTPTGLTTASPPASSLSAAAFAASKVLVRVGASRRSRRATSSRA